MDNSKIKARGFLAAVLNKRARPAMAHMVQQGQEDDSSAIEAIELALESAEILRAEKKEFAQEAVRWAEEAERLNAMLHDAQRDEAGADEDAYLIDRLASLLAEISVIVNGPEPAGTKWSYHDLPEKVLTIAALASQVQAPDANRLDWLEGFVRTAYIYGASFDFAISAEGESGGYRFMNRGRLGRRHSTIREAIDAAMAAEREGQG